MLTKYYDVLARHPQLRDEYAEHEAAVFTALGLMRGALVGFYGHENAKRESLTLSFGHVIRTGSIIDASGPFRQLAEILYEEGNEIRCVPLGLIHYIAFPNATGVWNIYNEESDLDQLFSEKPFFGAVTPVKDDFAIVDDDFADPYLSALGRLVKNFGQRILLDPDRVRGMLQDLAPEPKWCVTALVQAIQLGIVERLMLSSELPFELISGALIKQLCDAGPSEDRAKWAVSKWAVATGRMSQTELVWRNIFSRTLEQLDPAEYEGFEVIDGKRYEKITFEAHEGRRLGKPLAEYLERKKAHYLGPQSRYSVVEAVTRYLNAYVVLPEETDIFDDVPHWADANGVEIRNRTIVRVRDVAGRLMFSYGFIDQDAAGRALSALKTFHQNRSNIIGWARSKALVTERDLDEGEQGLRNFLAEIALSDIPVVIGFYDPTDTTWPRADVVALLQEAAPEFAGKCRFHVAKADLETLRPEYQGRYPNAFVALPSFAAFVRGALVAFDEDQEIGGDTVRSVARKALEFANEIKDTAACWLLRPELDGWSRFWFGRVRDGRNAFDDLLVEWYRCVVLVTSSAEHFADHIRNLCGAQPDESTAVGAMYAPAISTFWKEAVTPCADTSAGIRLILDVATLYEDGNEAELAVPQIVQFAYEKPVGPKIVPAYVEWSAFVDVLSRKDPAVVLLCANWDEWCSLRATSEAFGMVDYLYFVGDPDEILAWVDEYLSSPDAREYELDGSNVFPLYPCYALNDGGGYKPSKLPMLLAVRPQTAHKLIIVDCAAVEYTLREPNKAVFPKGCELKFAHWSDGTLKDLNDAVSEFLSTAAEDIQCEYEGLIGRFHDELRNAGKFEAYLDAADNTEIDQGDDPLAEQAESNFVSAWDWPQDRKPESYLADAVSLLKERLNAQNAVAGN